MFFSSFVRRYEFRRDRLFYRIPGKKRRKFGRRRIGFAAFVSASQNFRRRTRVRRRLKRAGRTRRFGFNCRFACLWRKTDCSEHTFRLDAFDARIQRFEKWIESAWNIAGVVRQIRKLDWRARSRSRKPWKRFASRRRHASWKMPRMFGAYEKRRFGSWKW